MRSLFAALRRLLTTLAVSRLTKEDRLPHLLLYGPPGTGKTTTILALARSLYGASSRAMTLELNASDERGIDVVREQIQDFASTKRIFRQGMQQTATALAVLRAVSPLVAQHGVQTDRTGRVRRHDKGRAVCTAQRCVIWYFPPTTSSADLPLRRQ